MPLPAPPRAAPVAAVPPAEPGLARQARDLARLLGAGAGARWMAALGLALVAVIALTAWAQIRLNAWNEPFYDALTRKQLDAFLRELGVFAILAGILLVLNVAQLWLDQTLKLVLRRALFTALLGEWMAPGRALRLTRAGRIGENPDQRLQADVDSLCDLGVALAIGLIQSTLLLAAFIGVLWTHSGTLTFPLGGQEWRIPGFMVWCAVAYAGAASWLSWRIGRPLVAVSAERAAREADFRFELVRVSEAAEAIALHRGEAAEVRRVEAAFARVVAVVRAAIRATVRLTWVTSGYGWFTIVAPILAAAPFYFTTAMSMGQLMLMAGAFNQVQGALRWFVTNFAAIATWRATLGRVSAFHRALEGIGVDAGAPAADRILRLEGGEAIAISRLRVVTPYISLRLAEEEVRVGPGERVLLQAGTGAGKTTLFRALAGLWDRGAGQISIPTSGVMYLPSRSYVAPGTLAEALCYPLAAAAFEPERIAAALGKVGLGHLAAQIGKEARWYRLLGESEKQSLSFARVLLHAPRWLIMDDVLMQLEPEALARIGALMMGDLAGTAILAIGNGSTPPGLFPRKVAILPGPGVPEPGAAAATVAP